jgi:hypothetical protein
MPDHPLPVIDLEQITDAGARHAICGLLNLVEELVTENRTLRAEVQRLRDENNRLKGEQGRPTITANTKPAAAAGDHSSERERRRSAPRQVSGKLQQIAIDRTEVLAVDPTRLPPDAEFKGHEPVVVQDVVFRTDNVLFQKEKWYSPSAGTSYLAPLPPGYTGEFGPGLKALTLVFYYAGQMSEPKILEVLRSVGVKISAGHLSNLLIKDQEPFHAEKAAIVEAGMRSSPWQHTDDTATRVNGQNQHCHILCNPLYTAYTTLPGKDRLSVLDVLRNGRPRTFLLNDEALGFLARVKVSALTRQRLLQLPCDQVLDEPTLRRLADEYLGGVGAQQRKWILDALAVAAYHAQAEGPVVQLLVCDDAPQFTWLTEELGLCWVHEGRHYKKLDPYLPQHRQAVERFLTDFWSFYDELLAYRQQPSEAERGPLAAAFDTLFARETGYARLDERIALTRGKKAHLLLVLTHPEIPLHNNPAELGARQRVRKRDVSFGPRTVEGARAWDTFMTLAATARKLGVSFYHYMHDRVSGRNRLLSLADHIDQEARGRNLGASWTTLSPAPPTS